MVRDKIEKERKKEGVKRKIKTERKRERAREEEEGREGHLFYVKAGLYLNCLISWKPLKNGTTNYCSTLNFLTAGLESPPTFYFIYNKQQDKTTPRFLHSCPLWDSLIFVWSRSGPLSLVFHWNGLRVRGVFWRYIDRVDWGVLQSKNPSGVSRKRAAAPSVGGANSAAALPRDSIGLGPNAF